MPTCAYEGCPEERWEGDEQHCIFHSQVPDKDPDLFRRALAAKKDRNYRGYWFPAEVDFSGQTLVDADFRHARFARVAIFTNAKLEGEQARFREAQFVAGADFREAQFAAAADFTLAQFAAAADFSYARFAAAHFSYAQFAAAAGFFRARFEREASFIDTRFQATVSFDGADLDNALFRDAALHRCTFGTATGLEEARFENVDWGWQPKRFWRWRFPAAWTRYLDRALGGQPERNDWRHLPAAVAWSLAHRRNVLGDELRARESRLVADLARAELVYHQLLKNYEDQREYPTANDFHYGEMEMRRLRGWQPLLTLYGLLSGYGHAWMQSFLWLIVVLLLSAWGYGGAGLAPISAGALVPGSGPTSASTALSRDARAVDPTGPAWPFLGVDIDWDATASCLVYSLRSAVLQFDREVHPLTAWGRLVQAAEFVLGPLLIALTGLALRRKFKR